MRPILTVTLNAAIDTTLMVPETIQLGESYKAQRVLKLPGGKGLNVARVLHTLGLPVTATGFAGGLAAEFLQSGLSRAGIEATFQQIAGETRTCTAIVELNKNRVTEVNEPGPAIQPAEVEAFLTLFRRLLADVELVALSGSLPPGLPTDFYARLIEVAHGQNVPVSLDTSGAALRPGVEARPLLVKPNATEIQTFVGGAVRSVEEAVQAGQRMRQHGVELVAITLGAEGAVLVSACGAWYGNLSIEKPVSTVGCGDAFVAGMLAALYQAVECGASSSIVEAAAADAVLEQAFRQALACGTANTRQPGAGVLQREDVEWLMQQVLLQRVTV